MQLHAFQAELADLVQLAHRAISLQRVDAAETDESVRVGLAGLGDQGGGDSGPSGGGLGVKGEQRLNHVERLVVARELVERAPRDLGGEVRLGGLDVSLNKPV